jgi:hypothetical protein
VSASWMKAKSSGNPMDAEPQKPISPELGSKGRHAQSSEIVERIDRFRTNHGAEANWWWREINIPLFGIPDDSFFFRQIFNDPAYFYELKARENSANGTPPAYPLEKPFYRPLCRPASPPSMDGSCS